MFINYSNHSSKNWFQEQLAAAAVYGDILDVPFVDVNPLWSAGEVAEKAAKTAEELAALCPAAVMCQGEFTFTYALVNALKKRGIICLAACTVRKARETVNADGSIVKESVFVFEQFREFKNIDELTEV